MKTKENYETNNLNIKLGNLKATGGLTKYATISGYITPKSTQACYEATVSELKEKLLNELKTNVNDKVFFTKKILTELSIKNNRLNPSKPSFFYFEFYLRLIDETMINKRNVISDELNSLSQRLVENVFSSNNEFVFEKTL